MSRGMGPADWRAEKTPMRCPMTEHDCQTSECLERNACALQRGAGYSQLQQEATLHPSELEQAQADSLEAHSLKYHHCAQIFQLSSGKFALFGSYQVASGIDLLAIGTWQELEEHVKSYRLLADKIAAEPRKVSLKPKSTAAALDYSELFGDTA